MLQEINRLKKVRDFNLLMKCGRWINGQFLDLKILDLKRLPQEALPKRTEEIEFRNQLKIAFTVGLKIDKRAVVRNRIKRQMREVVRLLIKEDCLKTGYYGLFVARAGVKDKKYDKISEEIKGLLSKGRILK